MFLRYISHEKWLTDCEFLLEFSTKYGRGEHYRYILIALNSRIYGPENSLLHTHNNE